MHHSRVRKHCISSSILVQAEQPSFQPLQPAQSLPPPAVFRVACRNLLAIPLEGTPTRCGLCGMPTTSPLHYIDCHSTRSQERLFLHNSIRKLIERLTRVAGGQYRTEPLLDDRLHRSRRGDTHLFLPAHGSAVEQQIFVDVQCLNPLAPSRIASYVNVATSLDRAEKMKSRKYSAAAQDLNAKFIPFIVTLQGDIGPAAMALLERLSSQAQRPLNIDAAHDCHSACFNESTHLG